MSLTDSLNNLRVLLVDDDPFIRRITTTVLNSIGISAVLDAENGEDAITLLKQNNVDLLISDIQMPEMNGIELIKQIRMGNTAVDRDLRTLVISSFSNTEVLSSCIALDINGFLVKPITQQAASEKIVKALSESPHLKAAKEYAPITSDLSSLEAIAKEERKQKEINATILRDDAKKAPEKESATKKFKGVLVMLKKLEPGMILADDIYTDSGQKLVSEGQPLKEGLINRLIELESVLNSTRIPVKLDSLVD